MRYQSERTLKAALLRLRVFSAKGLHWLTEVSPMRFHATGLVVFALLLLLALVAGAVPAVAILRVALLLFVLAGFVEVIVNMVRYRDMHVRSRLWGLLVESTTFTP